LIPVVVSRYRIIGQYSGMIAILFVSCAISSAARNRNFAER